MKPRLDSNKKKLTLLKQKIADLSPNEMNNIVAGNIQPGTIGGKTKSTVHDLTCTACTHTSNQSDAGKC